MENGLKNIKDLFDGTKIFKVPMYQRAYSWSKEQVLEFYDDIINQKINRTYFLGTILLENADSEGDFRVIEIVDGQQRMTTLAIYMKVLLNHLKPKYDVEILEETYTKYKGHHKLRLQDEDNEFFQTYILENTPQGENISSRPSQKKLLYAKNYFETELSKLNEKELLSLKEKINQTKVLTYLVEDNAEATLIFETTNDRGKPLTNLEKIKSFLMYKYYVSTAESSDTLKNIYKRFSDIYNTLEKIGEEKEDNILQYHFIAFEEWGNRRDYQKYLQMLKDKVNRLLFEKKDVEVAEYIEKYTTKLRETFSIVFALHSNKSRALREIFILERLGAVFYPLLIKAYDQDASENKKEFEEVTKILEIFSFRVLGMKTKRTNDVESAINAIVRDFKGDFANLKIQIAAKIFEYCNDKKFQEKLSSTDLFNELYSRDRLYLFWQYENYLRNKTGHPAMPEEEFLNKNKRTELTIEHIAPQNPEELEERIVTTADCKFSDYMSKEFKEQYLHSIGNLTFDPRSSNAQKGRKSIEDKNSKYFRKAPFMTQNELEDFINDGYWNEDSINERKEKIINFALERWNPRKIVEEKDILEFTKARSQEDIVKKEKRSLKEKTIALGNFKVGDNVEYAGRGGKKYSGTIIEIRPKRKDPYRVKWADNTKQWSDLQHRRYAHNQKERAVGTKVVWHSSNGNNYQGEIIQIIDHKKVKVKWLADGEEVLSIFSKKLEIIE